MHSRNSNVWTNCWCSSNKIIWIFKHRTRLFRNLSITITHPIICLYQFFNRSRSIKGAFCTLWHCMKLTYTSIKNISNVQFSSWIFEPASMAFSEFAHYTKLTSIVNIIKTEKQCPTNSNPPFSECYYKTDLHIVN